MMNKNRIKRVMAVLVLALCVTLVSPVQTEAVSRPAKPKFRLVKRDKKSATLKVKNGKGVTGYRVYLKTGKKGKWVLYDIVLHSSKIKLTKLKSNKIYYVKLKAWKTKGRSFRVSHYSKTIKIGKYQKKTTGTNPTPQPTAVPGGDPASGAAVAVSTPAPTPVP